MFQIIKFAFSLGLVAFGGPAAHIAMMHRDCVDKKKWLTDDEFAAYMSLTHLIPGPNSTEMMMLLGAHKKGFLGIITAGISFILPAAILTGALTWVYKTYQTIPQFTDIFAAIQLAVIALIIQAVWTMSKKNLNTRPLQTSATVAAIAGLLNLHPLGVLAAGLASYVIIVNSKKVFSVDLMTLFITCTKIGAVLVGGGYVLIAYFERLFVQDLGWITQQQLLDLIAIGQLTPGPILTSSTALGYFLADTPGAVLATLGIFLPSFLFVMLINKLFLKVQHKDIIQIGIKGLTAGALGLMIAVSVQLAAATLTTLIAVGICIVFLGIFTYTKIPTPIIIIGAAVIQFLKLQISYFL